MRMQSFGSKLQGILRAGKSYGVVIQLLHESQKAGESLAVEHAKSLGICFKRIGSQPVSPSSLPYFSARSLTLSAVILLD